MTSQRKILPYKCTEFPEVNLHVEKRGLYSLAACTGNSPAWTWECKPNCSIWNIYFQPHIT